MNSRQPMPGPTLRRRAARLLPWVDSKLRREYRTASLGNKRNPLDELIYIQLSVRTREGTYHSTYPSLRRLAGGRWDRLREIPVKAIVQSIRAGGMAGVKVARIRGMLDVIAKRFGRATLSPLGRMNDDDAESFLRSLPGVGPKVARCVMLYSLDREVFPVDSHCRRVLARLGLLPEDVDIKQAHDFLQALVPKPIRRSLHVNLVHHGRAVCAPVNPRCGECVLLARCPSGRLRLAGDLASSAKRHHG